MENHLSKYRITAALVGSEAAYERLLATQDEARPGEIEEAISIMVPQASGHPLVRIGKAADGGYLVPDDLDGIEACYSPGTNNFKDFEDHLSRHLGIKAFMCDYTSDVSRLRTPLIAGLQEFEKKWLDVTPSDDSLQLDDWVARSSPGARDLLLQMDIEGAEYRNLMAVSDATLRRFRVIVIEVHDLQLLARAQFLRGVFMPAMQRLGQYFQCVHAHANNACGQVHIPGVRVPRVIELTFLRRDRVRPQTPPAALPHPLDVLNTALKPPIHLQGAWLSRSDETLSRISALEHDVAWLMAETARLRQNEAGLLDLVWLASSGVLAGTNVARGGRATQSSLSRYSTPEGAGGGINGVKTGRFGFHTGFERNPWWAVDLGGPTAVDAIVLYNRLDACAERVAYLIVSVSDDGKTWTRVHENQGRPPFGGIEAFAGAPPLVLKLGGRTLRHVRIETPETTALHLDEVEIYGRPAADVSAPAPASAA